MIVIVAIIFAIASFLEFFVSPMDSFVLALISALYVKSIVARKESYLLVASLMAFVFAILSTLVVLAEIANYTIFGNVLELKSEYGLVGYIGVIFLRKWKNVQGKTL